MQNITRRLFLRNTAAAGAVGVVAAAPAVAEPMTPDERIDAAIEEIKAALREKWPDCPLRIVDTDNTKSGMVIVLTHVSGDKPGAVSHVRNGIARPVA